MKTCVPKESANCNDFRDRMGKFNDIHFMKKITLLNIDLIITSNVTHSGEEYPTIEADINALEVPGQKDIAAKDVATNIPKQFGCQSYCQNQGVCVLAAQSVSCQCAGGYTGLQCQVARKIKTKENIYYSI